MQFIYFSQLTCAYVQFSSLQSFNEVKKVPDDDSCCSGCGAGEDDESVPNCHRGAALGSSFAEVTSYGDSSKLMRTHSVRAASAARSCQKVQHVCATNSLCHCDSESCPEGGAHLVCNNIVKAGWRRSSQGAAQRAALVVVVVLALALALTLPCAPSFVYTASATTVRYRGSVYHGVTDSIIKKGGATFSIQVAVPAFPSNRSELVHIMSDVLTTNVRLIDDKGDIVNSTTFWLGPRGPIMPPLDGSVGLPAWRAAVAETLRRSVLEAQDGGRRLFVKFEDQRDWELPPRWSVLVVPCLPLSLFKEVAQAGVENVPNNCLAGDPFVIHHTLFLQLDKSRWDAMSHFFVTGSPVAVPLASVHGPFIEKYELERRLRVVEGPTCLHTRGASVRGSLWDVHARVYRFTPHRGGVQTLCYMPYPDKLPLLRVKVMDSYEVSGPEGISTDPPQVRSELEFTGTIYGTNLTERDTAVITEQLCTDFITQNIFFVQLFYSSATRVSFFGTFHKRGIYHICYHHEASQVYVRVSTLLVEKGSEVVIDNDNPNLLIDQDVKLTQSASVTRLKVQNKGKLDLRHRSLNVSSFVWSGGSITGKGMISCTGYSKITTQGYETRQLLVPLYNYGEMTIDVQRLSLERDGVIHNYGNLTLSVSSMGEDGISSVQSQGRINSINNHAHGFMRIIALDRRSYTLLTNRFIFNEGTVVVLGRVNMTDVSNGIKSTFVLKRDTALTAYNARLGGDVILEDRAELTVLDGCVFVSATANGTGTLVVQGDGVLLDSLTVGGSLNVLVGGPAVDGATVSVYGTTSFGPHTFVHIENANFVTSTGLAKLLFSGTLIVAAMSSMFAENMVIQASGVGVFYNQFAAPYLPTALSPTHSAVTTFFSPPHAVIYFVHLHEDALFPNSETGPSPSEYTCATHASTVSQYMTLGGRLVLHGCCFVPLGGTVTGSVEALRTQAQWDALREVACEHRLSAMAPFCATKQLLPRIRTGVAFAHELHARDAVFLDLDEFSLMNGTMHAVSSLLMEATDVLIGTHSLLNLDDGGRFIAKHVQVDGLLRIGSPHHTTITSSLEVGEEGRIEINGAATHCRDLLRVHGTLTLPRREALTCITNNMAGGSGEAGSNGLTGDANGGTTAVSIEGFSQAQTLALEAEYRMRARVLVGLPFGIPCPREVLEEMDERRSFFMRYWIKQPYNPPMNVPSKVDMILGVMCIIASALFIFLTLLRLWGWSITQWYRDFLMPSPLKLTLTWYEFSYSTLNYVAFCAIGLVHLQSTMATFHPGLPASLPLVSVLCLRSMNLLMPHHHLSPSQMQWLAVFVSVWCTIAFVGVMKYQRRTSPARGPKAHAYQYLIYIVQKVDIVAVVAFTMFQGPIMSFLLDGIACPTMLRHLPCCEPFNRTPVRTVMLCMYALLVSSIYMPWAIARNQRHATGFDLHMKVAGFFLMYTLGVMEVSMWKVCYSSPVLLVVSSCSFHLLYAVLHARVPFSAYRNVNRCMLYVGMLPLLIYCTIFVHVARVRVGWIHSCTDGELAFRVVFAIAAVTFFVTFWRNILYARIEPSESVGDASVDAIKRSILQIRGRINDLKVEAFGTTEQADRENILNAIARLRIEFLEKHERYRYETHRILRSFHLGSQFEDTDLSLPHYGTSSRQSIDGSPIGSDVFYNASSSFVHSPTLMSHSSGLLTVEEMETFSCGPALGKGSYGTVHLGILTSGKLVAVKYVNVNLGSGNQEALESVKAEVNMLRELSHPNIIRYYGAHTIHDTMLVFMEFAVGGSLTSILRKFTQLTEPVMQLYTYQILRGLQYLHGKGVVHRDIKGENILIDGSGVAKLADFGCSKSLANIANASHVGCGTLVGSPFWMAPEVIRSEAYGTKADIWSVGCTVVEMLNGGEPPWREEFDNVYSAMFYVGSTTDIPQIPVETSELCRDFLYRCFERDVAKRPSAEELLQHPWLSTAMSKSEDNFFESFLAADLLSSSSPRLPPFQTLALERDSSVRMSSFASSGDPRTRSGNLHSQNVITAADNNNVNNSNTDAATAGTFSDSFASANRSSRLATSPRSYSPNSSSEANVSGSFLDQLGGLDDDADAESSNDAKDVAVPTSTRKDSSSMEGEQRTPDNHGQQNALDRRPSALNVNNDDPPPELPVTARRDSLSMGNPSADCTVAAAPEGTAAAAVSPVVTDGDNIAAGTVGKCFVERESPVMSTPTTGGAQFGSPNRRDDTAIMPGCDFPTRDIDGSSHNERNGEANTIQGGEGPFEDAVLHEPGIMKGQEVASVAASSAAQKGKEEHTPANNNGSTLNFTHLVEPE